MADVNFTQYGENGLRIFDSTADLIEFGANNGYELGVVIGLVIVLFFFIFVFVFMARHINKIRRN